MKVFRLNEYDWVYAENVERALEWYMNETGLEKDEAYDEHYFEEIDPNKGTTLIHIDDLWVRKTFAQVVESEKLNAPCIIASSEY